MVRHYQRKSDRGNWSPESMKGAIDSVIRGEMGYKKAARIFNVPQTTLERRVKIAKEQPLDRGVLTVSASGNIYQNQPNPILVQPLGPIQTVFTTEEEYLLVDYILKMEERLFGLTSYDLRLLAYQWAEKLGKHHTFNKDHKIAGKDWLSGFKSRHRQLTLRKPEATSAARAAAFNKVNVGKFFDLLTRVVDENKLTPDRIYNCDETGVTVVPKHRSKILSLRGRKQVGCLTSAERGNTITIEVCFSAAGAYMPPLFVFPRVRGNDQLMNDCPPGAWAEYHSSGWMQSDIFVSWFKKFVAWSHASKDSPVLLLLDGHFTHTKNMALIDYARDNGVIMLCFPPHCTHRLQPLDVSFMKPLSVFYDQEVAVWLRSNPGRVVSQFQIAKLYGNAFVRAATMTTAVNGFRKTGVWPLNPAVFVDHDFAPSETTDRKHEPTVVQDTQHVAVQDPKPTADQGMADPVFFQGSERIAAQVPDPVPCQVVLESVTPKSQLLSKLTCSPEDILPIPSCSGIRSNKKPRKHGKTAVITESPYKSELQVEINVKAEKELQKIEKSKKREEEKKNIQEKKIKKNKAVKYLGKSFDCVPSSAKQLNYKCDEVNKTGLTTRLQLKRKTSDSSSSSDSSDAECLYCGYLYSQSNEGWIRCCKCQKWAHCSCAGEEDEDDEAIHLCDICKNYSILPHMVGQDGVFDI